MSTQIHYKTFLDLPDDILYLFFSYCDIRSVARLACCCKRLNCLIQNDCLWVRWRDKFIVVTGNPRCSVKELCRKGNNWQHGVYSDIRVVNHRTKQLPWIQVENDCVWISDKNLIKCYRPYRQQRLDRLNRKTLDAAPGKEDVCRFRCKDRKVVCGSRAGAVSVYDSRRCVLLARRQDCHDGDVHDVDITDDVIVTGSRDATAKVWSLRDSDTNGSIEPRYTTDLQDRVWSVAMHPNGDSFAIGTAGVKEGGALSVWDLERGEEVRRYGEEHRRGAGVLDLQYESGHMLFSCGYDTAIRAWDLRSSSSHCVLEWEDPFDSTVYCVRSDGANSVLSGTDRYGVVRLWDKRHTAPVQMYYTGRSHYCNSPVYSLAFDSSHLYVALDMGINVLDFSVYKTS